VAAPKLRVVIDTETTGLSHRADAIVQVGLAYRERPDEPIQTWSEVCDPGERFLLPSRDLSALRINGLSVDEIKNGCPAEVVATGLREVLDHLDLAHGGLSLRAYNMAFDRPFLEAPPWSLRASWGPCIMKLAHRHLAPGGRWPRLSDACAALGIREAMNRAHDAASDARAALLVLERLESIGIGARE